MSAFLEALRSSRLDSEPEELSDRTWVYVPYDQLSDEIGPLGQLAPEDAGLVLIESAWKAEQRPVHKLKLCWVLAQQRHFALEQARRGVAVRYVAGEAPYADVLRELSEELGPLRCARPAERELRHHLAPLFEEGSLVEEAHEGWLSTPEDFLEACGDAPPWRMDAFYRRLRKRTGILMDEGKPRGGKFSHDADNRKFWDGSPPAPAAPRFELDEITREVVELVESRFADHPGELRTEALEAMPATKEDIELFWSWAKKECLPHFGPYEDAMSSASRGLFHTRVSPLLNQHRLLPRRVIEEALDLDLPLSSIEGFVRQILGWREFVRHVHETTDGFRELPEDFGPVPQKGGHAAPSFLGTTDPLPAAYWDSPSGLRCLDETVRAVWEDGYSHHIERLMVLSNLGTLLDVSPRELTDWFWEAYIDAYDWVVEPNVLGMGTFGAGALMTTKPYISGAAYIDKMSDHCGSCAFHPKKTCPITSLYWAFLARHEEKLSQVDRMRLPVASSRKRKPEKRAEDERVFHYVKNTLAEGHALCPDSLQQAREALPS